MFVGHQQCFRHLLPLRRDKSAVAKVPRQSKPGLPGAKEAMGMELVEDRGGSEREAGTLWTSVKNLDTLQPFQQVRDRI